MKNKTLFLCLALIMAIAFALTGCSGDSEDKDVNGSAMPDVTVENSPQETKEDDPTPTPGEPLTLSARVAVDGNDGGEAPEVKVGDTFSIFIVLEESPDYQKWCAFECALTYDSELFSVDEILLTEITQDTLSMSNPEAEPNVVRVGIASGRELTAFGDIVEVKCTALKAGECTVEFSEELVFFFATKSDGTSTTYSAALQFSDVVVTIGE